MPLHTYKCLLCRKEFEVLQRFEDDNLNKCNDEVCQLERYTGCNHHYTHLRENRGLGVLKKQLSSFNIKVGN